MIKKLAKFFPIAGILLFIYIISKVDLQIIAQNFLRMNWLMFAAAFILILPALFIKISKWKQLVNPFGVRLGLREGLVAWVVGFFIGIITPGRVGDLARAFYLKEKMKIGSAISTVVVDRILDVLVLMVWAVSGTIYILSSFAVKSNIIGIFFIVMFLFIFAIALFLEEKRAGKLLRPIYNFFVPEKYKGVLKTSFQDFYAGINLLRKNKAAILKATGLSFIAWLFTFSQYFILARAIGINIDYLFAIMAMPAVLLIEIVPISFSGIGTRDAISILFFSFAGISASAAVSFSLTILIFNYIYSSVGLLVWIKKPIKL